MPMPALQEVIYKLEVGEWTRHLKTAVALLCFLGFAIFYNVREFKHFSTQEAMDGAQLARNIADGRGFTTDFVRPLSVYVQQSHHVSRQSGDPHSIIKGDHPDLVNAPVYPLLLAGAMKVLPFNHEIVKGSTFRRYQPELMVACLNQALFLGAILLVFGLGSRLFDQQVAWLSAIVFAGTDLFWRFSTSGLSTMLLIVLFLLVTWCLVSIEQKHREQQGNARWFIIMGALTGILIGIGALTRYSFIWLLAPAIVFFALSMGQRRATMSLVTVAACLMFVAPWLARNHHHSGALFGLAGYTVYKDTVPQFDGTKLERYMSGDFEAALGKAGVDQFVRKGLVNLSSIIQERMLNLGGNWISIFFLAGLLVPFLNPGLNRLRIFILLSLLVLLVAQALGKSHLTEDSPEINSENLIVLVAPLMFIFGAAMFFLLLDQIELPHPTVRQIVTGAFGIVVCAPLIFTLLPPRSQPFAYPPYWPPMVRDVAGWMNKDELLMSDMPWAVAWYGNRKCMWLTLDAPGNNRRSEQSDFYAINDFQKPIQGLLLTRVTTDAKWFSQIMRGQDYAWGKFMLECLMRTNVPGGFPLKYSPPGFIEEGLLFLSDHSRWPLEAKTGSADGKN
jgi:hypothetical protein